METYSYHVFTGISRSVTLVCDINKLNMTMLLLSLIKFLFSVTKSDKFDRLVLETI